MALEETMVVALEMLFGEGYIPQSPKYLKKPRGENASKK